MAFILSTVPVFFVGASRGRSFDVTVLPDEQADFKSFYFEALTSSRTSSDVIDWDLWNDSNQYLTC